MATPDLLTDRSNKEVPSNTYTIRPNFQHKYVAELMRVTVVFGFFLFTVWTTTRTGLAVFIVRFYI